MSSRNLRKLKGKPAIAEEPSPLHPGDEEEADDLTSDTSSRPANIFSLLNESQSETDVKEDDDVDTSAPAPLPQTQGKRKRKKKKSSRRPAAASSEDNTVSEVDEVDASVLEVNRLLGEITVQSPATEHTNSTIVKNVLTIERKHLNPDAEMRRMFGRDVVDQRRTGRRRGPGHPRSFSMVTNVHRFPPPVKLGLSMELVEQRGSEQWFQFVHGPQYQEVEHQFLAAVESVNPDNILALMNRHPGHVNSMLQLSDVCRLGEDLALSAELLERALFTMEAAAHPLFSVTAGTARLDYRRRENRPLFLALFRHARALSERGCHRTALEFCKLLLSVQPSDDPLGAVLLVCHYALRAHEYQWLVRFHAQWEPVRNLSQLPSFAYSVPYAHLLLAEAAGDSTEADRLRQQADAGLQRALLLFPSLLPLLNDKCDVTPCQEVRECPLFQPAAERSQAQALTMLCRLYAERSSDLWKTSTVAPWLQRNALEAARLVEQKDPRVAEGQEARKKRYPGMPLSICRHVVVADVKEVMGLLPPEITSRPVVGHDPLPPPDGTSGYTLTRRPRAALGSSNPFAAFFYSMLPNFDPNNPPEALLDDGHAVAAAAAAAGGAGPAGEDPGLGGELRTSVVSLLDAMRDLLTNLSPMPATVDEDADLDESDDEAWADA
ncbi:transcription factor 25-like [Amphibalanus amphitrite]|uniref:transcription factor 25-like n=1 Tax=Amphibalanus amphitrite TaxID=1232801 RepID=UPI001C90A18F|nr:transcription factor 25-like [Amphibalanus amphitrite]XP_043210736.1 transcription factor 25-like [Amphibalanus amphitrite]XP_043210745.1 transcription factor 25-like [Amphibalanus amphitrite]